jgi:hypothetical protein
MSERGLALRVGTNADGLPIHARMRGDCRGPYQGLRGVGLISGVDPASGVPVIAWSRQWCKTGTTQFQPGERYLGLVTGVTDTGVPILTSWCETCNPGSNSSYELFENPCCGGTLPRTICLNHIGSTSHDGGVTLDFWNACSPDRTTFGSGATDDGIIPPPWIPDIRGFYVGGGGTVHDSKTFAWELILGVESDTAKTSIDPASPGRKNWFPSWWSQLVEDFDCPEQTATYTASGVTHTMTQSSTYYSFYVFLNQNYPNGKDVGGGLSTKKCAVAMVQIRKVKFHEVTDYGGGTVVDQQNPSYPLPDWELTGVMRGYIEQGTATAPNCNGELSCDPFALQLYLSSASFLFPSPMSSYAIATVIFFAKVLCGCNNIVSPAGALGRYWLWEEWLCTEQDYTCTEDQDCHLEWQSLGYDDDGNELFGWVTVCTGTGTYTASGPRVDLFICANGDPFPPPADPENAQADSFQEDTFQ